ncbi:PspC domain-containing protein [Palaeococcus ferrophilus]|uniref:PspC domain-containing protein n=1 Tax=Palaeococcus ferrophilus TaxID=83868 RepID=UPI00064EBBDA|nr:PspC domain-containing protein [Palaeococcus ferrophilus]
MEKRLYRSKKNRVFLGVLGGMGEYFDVDPTLLRVVYVIFLLASLGTAILLYLLLALVIPEEGVV